MAITKAKKQELVAEFTDMAKASKSIVFASFKGLPVNETITLRKSLRANQIGYRVTKKTLLKRALVEAGVTGEVPAMDAEIAIAYSDDLLAPAREIHAFAKTHKGQMEIVGGVFEGKFMDKSEMTAIATIPPREVLIGMFLNLINSPIQRFAVVVDQIAKKKSA